MSTVCATLFMRYGKAQDGTPASWFGFRMIPKDVSSEPFGEAAVIKRLRRTANALILEPESSDPRYKRIVMQDDSRIFGKVLNVIKTEDDEYVIEYANGRSEVY